MIYHYTLIILKDDLFIEFEYSAGQGGAFLQNMFIEEKHDTLNLNGIEIIYIFLHFSSILSVQV